MMYIFTVRTVLTCLAHVVILGDRVRGDDIKKSSSDHGNQRTHSFRTGDMLEWSSMPNVYVLPLASRFNEAMLSPDWKCPGVFYKRHMFDPGIPGSGSEYEQDVFFHQEILRYPKRVQDPLLADLFYVPFYWVHRGSSCVHNELNGTVERGLDEFRDVIEPWFQQFPPLKHGSPRFFTASPSTCSCSQNNYLKHLSFPMQALTCNPLSSWPELGAQLRVLSWELQPPCGEACASAGRKDWWIPENIVVPYHVTLKPAGRHVHVHRKTFVLDSAYADHDERRHCTIAAAFGEACASAGRKDWWIPENIVVPYHVTLKPAGRHVHVHRKTFVLDSAYADHDERRHCTHCSTCQVSYHSKICPIGCTGVRTILANQVKKAKSRGLDEFNGLRKEMDTPNVTVVASFILSYKSKSLPNTNQSGSIQRQKEDSIFCLEPFGDTMTRRSFYEDIILGCIPVVLRNDSTYLAHMAFSDRIPYQKMWVHVPLPKCSKAWTSLMAFSDRIPYQKMWVHVPLSKVLKGLDVIEFLSKVPLQVIREKQNALKYWAPALMFEDPTLAFRNHTLEEATQWPAPGSSVPPRALLLSIQATFAAATGNLSLSRQEAFSPFPRAPISNARNASKPAVKLESRSKSVATLKQTHAETNLKITSTNPPKNKPVFHRSKSVATHLATLKQRDKTNSEATTIKPLKGRPEIRIKSASDLQRNIKILQGLEKLMHFT
eukprot:CAMPEP_0171986096 /NCGR_PEP_ID=MMETSP0993-20121228/274693_1 /TAXON_ID=483369 /ORGANISM="non described non described, Strain CCMP2098" /LENGTH=715 /DNA_ID=CAMNT_0012638995 /DNA_START=10 /DNA_END=2159 /DNA_ORIENTATION=-